MVNLYFICSSEDQSGAFVAKLENHVGPVIIYPSCFWILQVADLLLLFHVDEFGGLCLIMSGPWFGVQLTLIKSTCFWG